MIPVGKDIGEFFRQQGGAHGQAAGQAFGGGNHVRTESVLHIGIHGAGTAVAGLNLIDHEEDILLLQERVQFFRKTGIQRDHAALALDAFDEDRGDGAAGAQLLQRFQIAGGEGGKAGRQGLIQLMIMILAGGGKGGQRPAVKAVFQRDDGGTGRAFVFRGPLAGGLDGALVGLGPGIGEEDLRHPRFPAQGFRQPGARSGVIEVGHVLHTADLLLHGGDPFIVRDAERGDGDAGPHVDILLAVHVFDEGTLAADDFNREALVRSGNIGFVKFEGIHCCLLYFYSQPSRRSSTGSSPLETIVPAPSSVRSSMRMEWGTRPSMIITLRTPRESAFAQHSTFGIMPPEMMPLL